MLPVHSEEPPVDYLKSTFLKSFSKLSLVSLGSVRWDVKPNVSGNREVYTLFYTNDINTEELTFKSVIDRSVFDPL